MRVNELQGSAFALILASNGTFQIFMYTVGGKTQYMKMFVLLFVLSSENDFEQGKTGKLLTPKFEKRPKRRSRS